MATNKLKHIHPTAAISTCVTGHTSASTLTVLDGTSTLRSASITPIVHSEPHTISFNNDTGDVIGAIDYSDGVFKFSGDTDESGKLFVDFVVGALNNHIDDIIKNKETTLLGNFINKI